MNKFLTIFTPTYNRGYRLEVLYNSLLAQSDKNFVWLIVDDGSKDDTREIIQKWQRENKLEILYVYQENSGKINALKTGLLHAKTDLFVTIDSDDILKDNMVERLFIHYQRDKDVFAEDELIGYILPSRNITSDTVELIPNIAGKVNFFVIKDECKYRGESTWVVWTKSFKKINIPTFVNEKFIIDDIYKFMLSSSYNLQLLDEVLVDYEYMNDGLTLKPKKNLLGESLNGYALYMLLYAMLSKKRLHRIKRYARYMALVSVKKIEVINIEKFLLQVKCNRLTKIDKILAKLYAIKYKQSYRKEFLE